MKKPSVCTACKHIYGKPCNGEDQKCANLIWLKEQQAKVKKGKGKK